MLIRHVVAAGLLASLSVGQVEARTLDQPPSYFESEGHFVSYPALAGGALGAVVGSIIALPAAAIAAPIGYFSGDTIGYAAVPISVVATGGAEVGYHVFGAIPWALKNALYDAPMHGIARAKGERPSGTVAAVDPPPSDPMLNQYLASTPPAARAPVQLDRTRSLALKPPPELTSLMLKRSLSPFVLPPEVARQFQNVQPIANIPARMPAPTPVRPAPQPAAVPEPVLAPQEAATPPPEAPSTPEPPSAAASVAPAAAPVPDSAPVPAPSAVAPAAESADRPTLKRKKQKKSFSERFGF